jgi:hypothetical protein
MPSSNITTSIILRERERKRNKWVKKWADNTSRRHDNTTAQRPLLRARRPLSARPAEGRPSGTPLGDRRRATSTRRHDATRHDNATTRQHDDTPTRRGAGTRGEPHTHERAHEETRQQGQRPAISHLALPWPVLFSLLPLPPLSPTPRAGSTLLSHVSRPQALAPLDTRSR